jgi:K+-transporting ATPase c subunit
MKWTYIIYICCLFTGLYYPLRLTLINNIVFISQQIYSGGSMALPAIR